MTDTSTSAPPTMLTREQISQFRDRAEYLLDDDLTTIVDWETVNLVHDHGIAALDRIEAQETEIGRLREALNNAYDERNTVVLLAAALASNSWMPVWVSRDPDEPEWPVLGIELQGSQSIQQVTWHLPPGTDTSVAYSPPQEWDGHTTDEKYERVRAFVADIAGHGPALAAVADTQEEAGDA